MFLIVMLTVVLTGVTVMIFQILGYDIHNVPIFITGLPKHCFQSYRP
jgi:hypothetical protein